MHRFIVRQGHAVFGGRGGAPGAGLQRVRFHDLRHSCATLLYEQGVPVERIQDVLGHGSPTITKLIYVEVTRQAQRSTTDGSVKRTV